MPNFMNTSGKCLLLGKQFKTCAMHVMNKKFIFCSLSFIYTKIIPVFLAGIIFFEATAPAYAQSKTAIPNTMAQAAGSWQNKGSNALWGLGKDRLAPGGDSGKPSNYVEYDPKLGEDLEFAIEFARIEGEVLALKSKGWIMGYKEYREVALSEYGRSGLLGDVSEEEKEGVLAMDYGLYVAAAYEEDNLVTRAYNDIKTAYSSYHWNTANSVERKLYAQAQKGEEAEVCIEEGRKCYAQYIVARALTRYHLEEGVAGYKPTRLKEWDVDNMIGAPRSYAYSKNPGHLASINWLAQTYGVQERDRAFAIKYINPVLEKADEQCDVSLHRSDIFGASIA
ncbi:MAG: hypothetical protein LBG16_05080, partial [Elusimicrobiota bacterium]|nr:hypothetical protein [Elusimicrobiota bacterium]